MRTTTFAAVAVAGLLLGAGSTVAQPTLHDLGVLPGGTGSVATAISDDGTAVTGWSSLSGGHRAFRWTAAAGLRDLGVLPGGGISVGYGINADGSIVVGMSTSPTGERAFRWFEGGGMQDMGVLPGTTASRALGISPDGEAVVGWAGDASPVRGFRWIGGTMQPTLLLPGGTWSSAAAVGIDGLIVVGEGDSAGGGNRAFRWTPSTGMRELGVLAGGTSAGALAVASDPVVRIVGWSGSAAGERAVRWSTLTPEDLGTLPGDTESRALCISTDGSTIGGWSGAAGSRRAFLHTGQLGMVDLNTYLPTLGVDLAGWTLVSAVGVSRHGTAVAGTGVFNGLERAWLVTGIAEAPPCRPDWDQNGVLNSNDIAGFLLAWVDSVTNGNLIADYNNEGIVNSNDLSAFLSGWVAAVSHGC